MVCQVPGTNLAPKMAGKSRRTTSSVGRNYWQSIQAFPRLLSGQFLNSLIKIGDQSNTRFDPFYGVFVCRNRAFYRYEDFSKCFTASVAWIVGEVLLVPFYHLVAGRD